MNLNDAAKLAHSLMREHLTEPGWTFAFDNAVRRFGACHYTPKKKITLSRALTANNDESVVRNVILHEIAHAIAGARAGHSWTWKAQARAIGCTGDRCYDPSEVNMDHAKHAPYSWVCPNGHTRPVWRRPTSRKQKSCGQCSPVFDRRYLLTLKVNRGLGVGR